MEKLTAAGLETALDYTAAYHTLAAHPKLNRWLTTLPAAIQAKFDPEQHGHLQDWFTLLQALPSLTASSVDLQTGSVRAGEPPDCDPATQAQ
jgi:tRNA (mo5U34)-methyltransferase